MADQDESKRVQGMEGVKLPEPALPIDVFRHPSRANTWIAALTMGYVWMDGVSSVCPCTKDFRVCVVEDCRNAKDAVVKVLSFIEGAMEETVWPYHDFSTWDCDKRRDVHKRAEVIIGPLSCAAATAKEGFVIRECETKTPFGRIFPIGTDVSKSLAEDMKRQDCMLLQANIALARKMIADGTFDPSKGAVATHRATVDVLKKVTHQHPDGTWTPFQFVDSDDILFECLGKRHDSGGVGVKTNPSLLQTFKTLVPTGNAVKPISVVDDEGVVCSCTVVFKNWLGRDHPVKLRDEYLFLEMTDEYEGLEIANDQTISSNAGNMQGYVSLPPPDIIAAMNSAK